jgi:IclR family KDG regulon transcriptional repressor
LTGAYRVSSLSVISITDPKFRTVRLSPALIRAFDILDAIAQSGEPPRVSALARDLGLPRNTAYELVNTLASRKLVSLDSDGRVRLGFHLFELGSVYTQSLDLFNEARPVVRELVAASSQTAHVAMLDGRHAVFLVKEEGSQSVRNLSAVGRRVPAHATAVGKAILAFQPREETWHRLDGARLERLTPNTITDVDALLADLDTTVDRRYSTDDEESNPEVCCLGVPIRNERGVVIAGMSVSAHRTLMTPSFREELARLLMGAGDQLSRRMGYLPALPAGHTPWNPEPEHGKSGEDRGSARSSQAPERSARRAEGH